jgi:hypothetical protein
MDFELPDDQEFLDAVNHLAELEGVSPLEAVRRAILWKGAQVRGDVEVMASYEAVNVKYRRALDRPRE